MECINEFYIVDLNYKDIIKLIKSAHVMPQAAFWWLLWVAPKKG